MFRLTIYDDDNKKAVDEFQDEDEFREVVEDALNDIETESIKSFTVSRISKKTYQKPFWAPDDTHILLEK